MVDALTRCDPRGSTPMCQPDRPGARPNSTARARWLPRRLAAVLLLLTLGLAVGAALLVRIGSGVRAIQTVSTPPAVVTGSALGADPTLRIATGPALAAMRLADSGLPSGRLPSGPVTSESGAATLLEAPPFSAKIMAESGTTSRRAARGMRFVAPPPGSQMGRASNRALEFAAADQAPAPPGPANGVAKALAGLDDAVAGVAVAAGADKAPLAPLTILVMGVDARPGEAIDIGVRPDALGVLRLDPVSGACRLLSVPRDTRADLPGYGQSKVNHALAVAGVPYQRQVVVKLLGLEIDRFVLVDFGAVEAVVDLVGGITLDVPEAFTAANGLVFAAGDQRLDGRQVLAYVQYRGGPDGDLGRIERQQQVLRALLPQLADLDIAPTIRQLLPVLSDHVRMDLSPVELVSLGQRFRSSCTSETLAVETLAGTTATFDDPLVQQPLSYLVVSDEEIERQRAWLLGNEPAASP